MVNLTCENCKGLCCRYVALEIDAPEEIEDFENLKWYVAHKNVAVYIEEDGTWNLEFMTPCKFLEEKECKCEIYDKRPKLCREYSHDECLFHNEGYKEVHRFESIEEIEKYIEEIFKKDLH